MLHNAGFMALDNDHRLCPVEHHADHGALGQIGADLRKNGLIARVFQEFHRKAGPLLIVNFQYTVPNHRCALGHGINRHIAALGVAADPDRAGMGHEHILQILLCQGLRRNHGPEAHAQVLLPAHQRIVCAPEGDEQAAVIQQKGDSCKLGILLFYELGAILGYAGIAKTDAFPRCFQ